MIQLLRTKTGCPGFFPPRWKGAPDQSVPSNTPVSTSNLSSWFGALVGPRPSPEALKRPAEVRGVFKKFAARPRRKTNFTTKRGVRDVTLLKRSLTQPLPNWSCCFAQAIGCCKKCLTFLYNAATVGSEQ